MRYLAGILLLLSGCKPFVYHDYTMHDRPVYPAVSVFINDGYVSASRECFENGGDACEAPVGTLDVLLTEELRHSGLFERVDTNNARARYRVVVRIHVKSADSDPMYWGKMASSIMSLYLIPIPYRYGYEATFTVQDGDGSLGKFSYELESDEIQQMFIDPERDYRKAIRSIVSNFLKDLEHQQVFAVVAQAQGER